MKCKMNSNIQNSMNTFRINAMMENESDKEPLVFTFNLPGTDEESIYKILENMTSVKRIISVENINNIKQ